MHAFVGYKFAFKGLMHCNLFREMSFNNEQIVLFPDFLKKIEKIAILDFLEARGFNAQL